MAFNEDTRVKIPAILHLCRLGYEYLSLKDNIRDERTNIFSDIFHKSINKINPGSSKDDIKKLYEDILLTLGNDDLGQEFFEILTTSTGMKLIDFNNISMNSFHVCTELTYKNGNDEFRPDISILVNGIPLAFIEVKKPNNRQGILAERSRINTRFQNKKFRKFINISQLLIFTNNMEYDHDSIDQIQGAFYSTTSYKEANFNYFREEEDLEEICPLANLENDIENFILKDNNLNSIKHSPEFQTNKNPNSPTNRILSSLLSKARFFFLLQYGFAYVNTFHGIEKHIMRYPQFFATKAIEKRLVSGERRGIIWHTQGSGKTALAFFNVHYLTDFYQKNGAIPRFYFIVDRLDLLQQAKREFSSRGLIVHTVTSKEELLEDFQKRKAISNLSGKKEITVVNIQKFRDQSDILKKDDYDLSTQRIYFLDEVHRSYDPRGSFLANLISSDRNAILIGLTGTPLIGKENNSKRIFGDYIHKYYYNASIADGYTLRLLREGIETNYKIKLQEALKEVEIIKGHVEKRIIFSHKRFVSPMLDYIIKDFQRSRIRFGDETIGGMIICDSSDQAKMMYTLFNENYLNCENQKKLTSALILHDVDDKQIRKEKTDDFKDGKIDLLFVYRMLLTGFDAKRLKKLYIGRVIRNHNLLQALTRVNRPYKRFKYGYVVDFADIRSEFDKTNKAYFEELQAVLGDDLDKFSNLFISQEDIEKEIESIKDKLFEYELGNSEVFSHQISKIQDREQILEIKKALQNARDLYNQIRLQGDYELLDKLNFRKLNLLLNETSRHLDLLNLKNNLRHDISNTHILNEALEEVIFAFKKISEDELIIADQLKNILRKTRESLNDNIDKKDPEFILLYDELRRLFKQKNLDEISQEEMKENISTIQKIYDKILDLNRRNALLKTKYDEDAKFVRVHKRITENGSISKSQRELFGILSEIKKQTDEKVLINTGLLRNESYFEGLMAKSVIDNFQDASIKLDPESVIFINHCVSNEYIKEFQGISEW